MQHVFVRNLHADLMEGRKGSRPAARRMRGLEDNIKMCLKQDGRSWTWINLAQDRDSWPAVAIPYTARKRVTSRANVSFSWQTHCVEVANSVQCV
jgi:hypothetical protein